MQSLIEAGPFWIGIETEDRIETTSGRDFFKQKRLKDLEEHTQKRRFPEGVECGSCGGLIARCEATHGLLVLEHQETLALSLLVCLLVGGC